MSKLGGACIQALLFGVALSLLPAFYITCTITPTAGGSTNTETGGVVAGVILDSNGTPASPVHVMLLPYSYNPVEDTLPDSNVTVTSTDGSYQFRVPDEGIYNLYAVRSLDQTRLLRTGIELSNDSMVTDTSMLDNPGTIKLLLPDTVDTADGYVYFKGTPIYKFLSGNVSYLSGFYAVTFDAVPATRMPSMIYAVREQTTDEVVIAPSVTVPELDTIAFGTKNNSLKPLWQFSLLVAVKNTVSSYFGGIDAVKPKVIHQVGAATKQINSADGLDGILHFSVDSVYIYTTSIPNEGSKTLGKFDYRLLYDTEYTLRDKIIRFSYIYVWNTDPDKLFGTTYTNIITKLLGEIRGALDQSFLTVDSADNEVNHIPFSVAPSIMSDPTKYTYWDAYSVSVINHNADTVKGERDILYEAFPDIMGMTVTDENGEPAHGADITVYGSELNTGSIDATPLVTGTADINGRYLFSTNPFKTSADAIQYGTLLLSAAYDGDTAYSWFAMNDAGNAFFTNPDTTLLVGISFEGADN